MAYRLHARRTTRLIALAGLAVAIGAALEPVAGADFPGCRNGNCPNCPVNARYFGYYPTLWRRWPGTEPQPQPAPQPAVDGVAVPPVEPPPPLDEIEKTKPMGTESPAGAGPAAGSSPMTEPAAKPGVEPMPDKATLPAPRDIPGKLNQLQPLRRSDPAAPFREGPGILSPESSPDAQVWPPANILRNDGVRATFQWPDQAAIPPRNPSLQAARESTSQPLTRQIDWRSNQAKPVDWQADTSRTAAPALPNAAKIDRATAVPAASATPGSQSLRWVEPVTPNLTAQRSIEASLRSANPPPNDAMQNGPTNRFASDPIDLIDARPAASLGRVPFVPSNSLREPLAPVDPRALTEHGTPRGVTPAEAASNRLAPPGKLKEISVPMFPAGVAKAPPPSARPDQDKVVRIDPLAIGKSLDTMKSLPDLSTPTPGSTKVIFPFADGVVPTHPGTPTGKGSVKADYQFAEPTTFSEGGAPRDHVKPASYFGAGPSPQPQVGRDNPLRTPAAAGGESLSTDGPRGWANPLR